MSQRQVLLSSLWQKASRKESEPDEDSELLRSTGNAEEEGENESDPDRDFRPTEDQVEVDVLEPAAKRANVGNAPEAEAAPPADIHTVFDVNSLLGRHLSNKDRAEWVDKCFCPADSYSFPARNGRKCNIIWLVNNKWLRFSPSVNGLFCLPCVLFGKSNSSRGQLVSSPLVNFHKGASAIERHSLQQSHLLAMSDMVHFQSVQPSIQARSSVQAQLLSANAQRVESNHEKLRVIVKSVLFLGRQNIPFRGHREPSTSGMDLAALTCDHNPGNFLALLHLLASSGCDTLSTQFEASHGASYISPNIQNQIIQCIGDVIRTDIVEAVRKSKFFTVLCDEASDSSNKEQMSLVIRYVDEKHNIHEDFIDFLLCPSTSGASVATLILERVEQLGPDAAFLRGQGYDGAANMAGRHAGAAAIIRSQYPKARYVHCSSHVLNLCIVSASKTQAVSDMWSTMTKLSLFFDNSPKRLTALVEAIATECPESKKTKLVSLCKTRWVARHDSLSTFEALYPAVRWSLGAIADNENRTWSADSRTDANGLLTRIESFDFLFPFIVAKKSLSHIP